MTIFITFEGPEGGGKSTQARRLRDRLAERSIDVLLTREPGGTHFGEALRDILLGSDYSAILPETEALLNTAARVQHLAEVVKPALAAGRIVISDRYVDSTLAYQGAGRGLDIAGLRALHSFATHDLWPDLTILLDVPYEVGQARRLASGEPLNRFDSDSRAFHERVRQYFLRAARDEPARWRVIDASGRPENVETAVLEAVAQRFELAGPDDWKRTG